MGVIYKIKPEVINFIVEEKKNNASLSCRGLTALVHHKFSIKLSKSSINSIIKNANLSMPVGRHYKTGRISKKDVLQKDVLPEPVAALPVFELTPPPAVEESKPEIPIPVATEPINSVAEPEIVVAKEIEPAEVKVPEPVQVEPPIPVAQPMPEPVAKTEEPEIIPEVRPEKEILLSGAILLRAMDNILKGSQHIAEVIKRRINFGQGDFSLITESIIYLQLLGLEDLSLEKLSLVAKLTGKQFSSGDIDLYLEDIQRVKEISLDVFRVLLNTVQPVRCVKVVLSDGQSLYLDGQLRTAWTASYVPYDFGTVLLATKSCVNQYFFENNPIVFHSAPGQEELPAEFINLLLGLEGLEKNIRYLAFFGNRLEELEIFTLRPQKRQFVFALWPGQCNAQRKIKKIGEFKPFYFAAMKREFFLAETEIALTQPYGAKSVTLRGCILQNSFEDKQRLCILSNINKESLETKDLASLYLNHWPNLEEGLQDFQRKIEFFTYTGNSSPMLSAESLGLQQHAASDIKALLHQYLLVLDAYFKWHFLPVGGENIDFPTMKEYFYNLQVAAKEEDGLLRVTFKPAPGFRFLRELKYACLRLNESQIKSCDDKTLWFQI